MATCKKEHHRKWCLSDKWRTKKVENCHIRDSIVLISTVQKKIVGRKPHSSLLTSVSYSSAPAAVLLFLCITVYKWPPIIPTWTALRCALSVRDDDLLLAREVQRLEGFECVQWVVLHFSVLYAMPSFHPTHSASVPHGPLGHSWLPSKLQASRSKEGGRHVSSQVASHT